MYGTFQNSRSKTDRSLPQGTYNLNFNIFKRQQEEGVKGRGNGDKQQREVIVTGSLQAESIAVKAEGE